MNIGRLKKIIEYSHKNREEINKKIRLFCSFARIDRDSDILNIFQIVRDSFKKKGYLVFEIPFSDNEIGALCYKDDGFGYVVINTSLPRVNINFAIAHEVYHVFFQQSDFVSKIEFFDENYYEHEEEYAANLFAGELLMPENSFRNMYSKFKEENEDKATDIIIRLMAYYKVPYMAVLIRCLELNLTMDKTVLEEFVKTDKNQIRQRLVDLWLDASILDGTYKDDYEHIEKMVENLGKEYVDGQYINAYTLKKALSNMRELYDNIKKV